MYVGELTCWQSDWHANRGSAALDSIQEYFHCGNHLNLAINACSQKETIATTGFLLVVWSQ